MLLLSIIISTVLSGAYGAIDVIPRPEFSHYNLIKPIIYHGDQRRETESLLQHPDHLTVILPTKTDELVLDLVLNTRLTPEGFFRITQGSKTHSAPSQLCHYFGKVRKKPKSWVALSTCDGLSGVIYDGHRMNYIEKRNGTNDEHWFFRQEDLITLNGAHGYTKRIKRAIDANNTIRGPYKSTTSSKYLELLIVVDNSQYKKLDSNVKKVEEYCQSVTNVVNRLYTPLNIFVVLVGVVIWTEQDEIEFSASGDTTLTNFLYYRRNKFVGIYPHDNAQLITNQEFGDGVVGKALKGPICTAEFSGGIVGVYSDSVGIVGTRMAHMIGHNLGMEHDIDQCSCSDYSCIMSRSFASLLLTKWSNCSLATLNDAFDHGMDHCLKNKPKTLFHSPVCGNGFLEGEEECDCGLPEDCDNECCNASTCKLKDGAKCATGKCCDLKSCKFKKRGVACRTSSTECDLPEHCTGTSEFCPNDFYKLDGELCDNGRGFCYQGHCGSHSKQCNLLWGLTDQPLFENCYNLNTKGTRIGNCGYSIANHSYSKCNNEDIKCGRLHCQQLRESLKYGLESVSILSHSFINFKGQIIPCRMAVIDLGVDSVDPGMVPNGANCGKGKMCVNQKCVAVSSVQGNRTCPYNCYNNGFCNNMGHCHCDPGFVQPYCEYFLAGGSVDSGPVTLDHFGKGSLVL